MKHLIAITTFLLFFPVGCTVLNDASQYAALVYLREKIEPNQIPNNFPLVIVWHDNAKTLHTRVIRYHDFQHTDTLPSGFRLHFTEDELPTIQEKLLEQSRYWNNAPSDASFPWSADLTQRSRIDDLAVSLKVNLEPHPNTKHTGWYRVEGNQFLPEYYLQRQGSSLQFITMPWSIIMTGLLWLAHLNRLKRLRHENVT